MTIADPLQVIPYGGKKTDRKTAAGLDTAARRLGYELTLMQGSYNEGVSASGGTHDRGGVVDLAPFEHARKVKVLRDLGFAAWYRAPRPGVWGAHVHAVMIGHQDLSPTAFEQTQDYKAGLDGLAGNSRDPNPYRPDVENFSYAAWLRDGQLVLDIKGLNARIKKLQDKVSAKKGKLTYRKKLKGKK